MKFFHYLLKHVSPVINLNERHTVKILIEAREFIRIMVDAEVGSGWLLEATVLEWDKQTETVMWNDICSNLPSLFYCKG